MHICLLWVWNQSVWIFWICWAGTCMLFWFEKWFKQGKLESKSARIVFFKFRSVSNVVDNAEKAPRDACGMKEVMRNRGNPRNNPIQNRGMTIFSWLGKMVIAPPWRLGPLNRVTQNPVGRQNCSGLKAVPKQDTKVNILEKILYISHCFCCQTRPDSAHPSAVKRNYMSLCSSMSQHCHLCPYHPPPWGIHQDHRTQRHRHHSPCPSRLQNGFHLGLFPPWRLFSFLSPSP